MIYSQRKLFSVWLNFPRQPKHAQWCKIFSENFLRRNKRSLSYVFNQKTKKTRTHTLTQCHFLFLFFSTLIFLCLSSFIHSLTPCWDSSKRFHGHRHRKWALLASLQQNSKLSHHFRPGLIYLLLSNIMFLTHMHNPDPRVPDTHFMRQNTHEPSHC